MHCKNRASAKAYSWLTGLEHKNSSCLFAAVESSPKDKICTTSLISFILFEESKFFAAYLWYYLFISSLFFGKGMVTRSLETQQENMQLCHSFTHCRATTSCYYYHRGHTRCVCCPGVAMSHLIHRTCSLYKNTIWSIKSIKGSDWHVLVSWLVGVCAPGEALVLYKVSIMNPNYVFVTSKWSSIQKAPS